MALLHVVHLALGDVVVLARAAAVALAKDACVREKSTNTLGKLRQFNMD
jgi:hypothetical protein